MAESVEKKKRLILTIAKGVIATREERIEAAKALAQVEGIELTEDDLQQLS
jgi:hypothetical protein